MYNTFPNTVRSGDRKIYRPIIKFVNPVELHRKKRCIVGGAEFARTCKVQGLFWGSKESREVGSMHHIFGTFYAFTM